jgi:hypothetical protein
MKQTSVITLFASIGLAAVAADQPPVRFVVEMREAGKIVECPSVTAVLGQSVSVPLSGGSRVVSILARPMDAEGRSRITVRFETPALRPDGLEGAYEMTGSSKLAQSSPTFQYGPERGGKTAFTVLVTSPPLLATTRVEPSWQQHMDKLTSEPSSGASECKPILGERRASKG